MKKIRNGLAMRTHQNPTCSMRHDDVTEGAANTSKEVYDTLSVVGLSFSFLPLLSLSTWNSDSFLLFCCLPLRPVYSFIPLF